MSEEDVKSVLAERQAQNVSVVEIDAGLSEYLSDADFTNVALFIDHAADLAHGLGMKAVIYYPSLEVLTQKGELLPNTMYKDHPDWIQVGLNGTPNVFYGSQESWVEKNAESAWMSPNTGYREYLFGRIRALAGTRIDGIWLDVPVYLETGSHWADINSRAAAAFTAWSAARGDAGGQGYAPPVLADFGNPAFRAFIRFRHENLAAFIDDARQEAQKVKPDIVVLIEDFPVDDMDATEVGLDGGFRINHHNFLRVWEIDSVSNTEAMKWANYEDYNSKLTMCKFARAIDRPNPTWSFSYGHEALDTGLTMAALLATGVVPFEARTPDMTLSADPATRTQWFAFVRDHTEALLATPRVADVGIYYSSATRDYLDFPVGGQFGMYITTKAPLGAKSWWANSPDDSALRKPHLGGYRGAAHALIQLGIPFRVIADPGPAEDYGGLALLWLPSVAALSDSSAAAIRAYVTAGGVVLATGGMPGTMDEKGEPRSRSALDEVFGFGGLPMSGVREQALENGYAIYRPDITAPSTYALAGDPITAAQTMNLLSQILRPRVPDTLGMNLTPGIHIEVGRASANRHYLYVVNYTGLKQPLITNPIDLAIDYRVPAGYQITDAQVSTPDIGGQNGPCSFSDGISDRAHLHLRVDRFSLVTLDLAPVN